MQNLAQIVGFLGLSLALTEVQAQELEAASLSGAAVIADLTADEYAALEKVTEKSVTGTISFLASDELAGRGTPSKEFLIATAYVASRLRAAGAIGLGPAGSYYLESKLDTVRTPDTGCIIEVREGKAPRFIVLHASENAFSFEGKIPLLADGEDLPDNATGPLAIGWDAKTATGPSPLAALRRRANELAKRNVPALIVVASPESDLWKLAGQYQREARVENPRGRIELPIVLASERTWSDDQVCQLEIPAMLHETATVRNVAAVVRGNDEELGKQAVIFSAHLDHLGDDGTGEDRVFNGADDDASGVTAVLTLADAFGSLESSTKRSVIFLTFWGEERGMLGSKEFVEASPWPLENVVAGINIEMVGRPEPGARNKFWMTGWTKSDLGPLIAMGSRRVGVENFEHPSLSARLYGSSDNISFVNKGVVAHSFSAGSLHGDYHQPSDEWQRLDLAHMTQVIRGLYAGTLPIVQGTLTPAKK